MKNRLHESCLQKAINTPSKEKMKNDFSPDDFHNIPSHISPSPYPILHYF